MKISGNKRFYPNIYEITRDLPNIPEYTRTFSKTSESSEHSRRHTKISEFCRNLHFPLNLPANKHLNLHFTTALCTYDANSVNRCVFVCESIFIGGLVTNKGDFLFALLDIPNAEANVSPKTFWLLGFLFLTTSAADTLDTRVTYKGQFTCTKTHPFSFSNTTPKHRQYSHKNIKKKKKNQTIYTRVCKLQCQIPHNNTSKAPGCTPAIIFRMR